MSVDYDTASSDDEPLLATDEFEPGLGATDPIPTSVAQTEMVSNSPVFGMSPSMVRRKLKEKQPSHSSDTSPMSTSPTMSGASTMHSGANDSTLRGATEMEVDDPEDSAMSTGGGVTVSSNAPDRGATDSPYGSLSAVNSAMSEYAIVHVQESQDGEYGALSAVDGDDMELTLKRGTKLDESLGSSMDYTLRPARQRRDTDLSTVASDSAAYDEVSSSGAVSQQSSAVGTPVQSRTPAPSLPAISSSFAQRPTGKAPVPQKQAAANRAAVSATLQPQSNRETRPAAAAAANGGAPPSADAKSRTLGAKSAETASANATTTPSNTPQVDEAMLKREKKRTAIIKEIIDTERVFVRTVEMVVRLFLAPLKDSGDKILKRKHQAKIFCNLEAVLAVNRQLLKQLEAESGKPTPCIGEAFQQWLVKQKIADEYARYCSNHPVAWDALKNCMSDPKTEAFAKWLRGQESANRNELQLQPLSAFLTHPVQRICKYPLLLRELSGATDEKHRDHGNLKKAIGSIETLVKGVNEAKAVNDSQAKIADFREYIQGIDKYAPQRFLLDAKFVIVPNPFGGGDALPKAASSATDDADAEADSLWVLFSNVLLHCSESSGSKNRVKVRNAIPTAQLWVDDVEASQQWRDERHRRVLSAVELEALKKMEAAQAELKGGQKDRARMLIFGHAGAPNARFAVKCANKQVKRVWARTINELVAEQVRKNVLQSDSVDFFSAVWSGSVEQVQRMLRKNPYLWNARQLGHPLRVHALHCLAERLWAPPPPDVMKRRVPNQSDISKGAIIVSVSSSALRGKKNIQVNGAMPVADAILLGVKALQPAYKKAEASDWLMFTSTGTLMNPKAPCGLYGLRFDETVVLQQRGKRGKGGDAFIDRARLGLLQWMVSNNAPQHLLDDAKQRAVEVAELFHHVAAVNALNGLVPAGGWEDASTDAASAVRSLEDAAKKLEQKSATLAATSKGAAASAGTGTGGSAAHATTTVAANGSRPGAATRGGSVTGGAGRGAATSRGSPNARGARPCQQCGKNRAIARVKTKKDGKDFEQLLCKPCVMDVKRALEAREQQTAPNAAAAASASTPSAVAASASVFAGGVDSSGNPVRPSDLARAKAERAAQAASTPGLQIDEEIKVTRLCQRCTSQKAVASVLFIEKKQTQFVCPACLVQVKKAARKG